MKSSSSALLQPAGVAFTRWSLADLSDPHAVAVEEQPAPELDEAALAAEAAAAAAEAARRAEEEARREAERQAEEVERRVREAYEQGYEEGRQEGEIAEGARLRHAVAAAEEALDELRAGEMRWSGTIEENICALAVAIARQMIGREIESDVGSVMKLVASALAEFPIDQPLRIRVNSADLSAMQSAGGSEAAISGLTRGREARWIADPHVGRGGCVVEGRDRIIDGRVDTALERIYRRLTYTNA